MSGKKVTPHQMRKNLAYVQEGKPDFMKMLTGQSEEAANKDPRNPYRKPIGIEAKFQHEEQDDDDETAHDILNEREEERPTVVVLKDGKHLDERQVKNILKNLPAGLSDAEIQKRLAEGQGSSSSGDGKSESEEEEEEDVDPVDANGKILFRRPKGSKKSTKDSKETTGLNSSKSKKSFEEIMLSEAKGKVSQLKRKSGEAAAGGSTTTEPGSKKATASKKTESSGTKKKPKTSKATSMLSFDDEE